MFSALGVFIIYPWLAALIGAVFLVLGRKRGRPGAVVVGLLWIVYAGYEYGMLRRWFCTGECNIRVDLLLIFPVLLLASVVAGWGLRNRGRR